MSARLAVLLAAPFVALAFALRLGTALWMQPLTWRIPSLPGALLTYLCLLALSASIPVGGYVLLTRAARRRPATWRLDADGRRFVAPASPYGIGPKAIFAGWWAGAVVLTERVPNQPSMRIAHLGVTTTISVILGATLLLGAVLWLMPNRPLLILDPDGITLQRPTKQIRIRWDELPPGTPPRPEKRNPAVVTLSQHPAGSTAPNPSKRQLPARDLHIDTAFLTHTISHYTEHVAHRANIGTPTELKALQQSFAT